MTNKTIPKIALIILIVLLFIPTALAADKLRFVIFPDTHIGSSGDSGIEPSAKKSIETVIGNIKPSFVIHTGDMIDIGRSGTEKDPKLALMWSRFDKAFTQPLLAANILFFPMPGNHDFHGGSQTRARYKQVWAKHKNNNFQVQGPEGYAGYYSFDMGNSHFVALHAPGTFELVPNNQQLDWLAQDLQKAKQAGKQHIFVFSHSPLFCPKLNVRCTKDMFWLRTKKFRELLAQYKAVHFGGHMHVFNDATKEGVRSIIDGAIGGGRRKLSGKPYDPFQFLVVEVDGPNFKYYQIKYPTFDVSMLSAAPPPTTQTSAATGVSAQVGGCPAGQMPRSMLPATGTSSITTASLATPGQPGAVSTAQSIGTAPGCIQNQRAAALGDSITYIAGKYRYGFMTKLKAHCNIMTFDTYGYSGMTTGYMLSKLKSQVLPKNYNHLIVMGGINDIAGKHKYERIKDNLEQIYKLANDKNMHVVAMTITPYKGHKYWSESRQAELKKVNDWILSKPPNVDLVINTYAGLTDSDGLSLVKKYHVGDKLHLGPDGNEVIANLLKTKAYPRGATT
ncbi:metallophosphoesterase [Nanoarchaeota archaeon]